MKSYMFKVILFFLLIKSQALFAVNIQQFNRSNSLTYEMIEDARLQNSHVKNKFKYMFNLGFSLVDEPLTVKNSNNSQQVDSIIKDMKSIHLGISYYIFPAMQLSLSTAYSFFENNQNENISDFQDIELKLKYRLINERLWAFSLMPKVVIPLDGGNTLLTNESNYSYGRNDVLSDNGLGLGLMAIYERIFTHFQISINLQYYFNEDAVFEDGFGETHIDKSEVLTAGVGAYIPIHRTFGANIEYIKNFYAPLFNDNLNPSELFVGLSSAINYSIHGFFGFGFGNLLSDSDGNDYRAIAGIKIIPQPKEEIARAKSSLVYKKKPTRIVNEAIYNCQPEFIFGETNAFTVTFPNDSDVLSNQQITEINKIALILKQRKNDIREVKIIGHTSIWGPPDYNEYLGQRRAQAVYKQLNNVDLDIENIVFISSQGESDLLTSSEFNKDKFQRRTEVLVELKENAKTCTVHSQL